MPADHFHLPVVGRAFRQEPVDLDPGAVRREGDPAEGVDDTARIELDRQVGPDIPGRDLRRVPRRRAVVGTARPGRLARPAFVALKEAARNDAVAGGTDRSLGEGRVRVGAVVSLGEVLDRNHPVGRDLGPGPFGEDQSVKIRHVVVQRGRRVAALRFEGLRLRVEIDEEEPAHNLEPDRGRATVASPETGHLVAVRRPQEPAVGPVGRACRLLP